MIEQIPVYKPNLSGNEFKYVNACLDKGWISSKGEFVGRFENAFADYLHCGYATSVSNGTVALHLAFHTLGIGRGDEVIVPTLTYVASVNAITITGADPVFVDSEPKSWNIDCTKIEEKITKKTKAILSVHLYGAMCDMNALRRICKKHNLYLIEDAAEAFGSKFNGQNAGTFGEIGTFSFFGNKTITTGEGGMVVSKHPRLIKRAAFLKSQAVSAHREYWHQELGFNYRMTNICAAIGLAQLQRANEVISKKILLAKMYQSYLNTAKIEFQKEPTCSEHSFWMVSCVFKNKKIKNKIRKKLKENGIETRPLFYPAHTMPVHKRKTKFAVAESISERGVNLPSWPDLKASEIEKICDIIRKNI